MNKQWKGDGGETSNLLGERVPKDSIAIQAVGSLDELNSFIGLAISEEGCKEMNPVLESIQEDIMKIASCSPLPTSRSEKLEETIKNCDKELEELSNFILPGGCKKASFLHVSRTMARRAEREMVALSKTRAIDREALRYMNRLSDALFQLARLANRREGKMEKIWKGANHSHG